MDPLCIGTIRAGPQVSLGAPPHTPGFAGETQQAPLPFLSGLLLTDSRWQELNLQLRMRHSSEPHSHCQTGPWDAVRLIIPLTTAAIG